MSARDWVCFARLRARSDSSEYLRGRRLGGVDIVGLPFTVRAARLCAEAAGGQILVSARVAAEVEGMIDAESLGPIIFKGLARPVPVWSVRGLRPREH